MGFLRDLLSLVSFLTIYPVPSKYRSLYDAASAFYLSPMVGFLRGVPGFIILTIAGSLPQQFLAGFAIALHIIIQGFLHIDGFIDFSEALLASRFGRDARAIMKDRYRGSYGIASMGLYIALLYSSLSSIDPKLLPVVYLLGEVIHGGSMVICMGLGRVEPYEGLGSVFKRSLSRGRVAISMVVLITLYSLVSLLSLGSLPLYQLVLAILAPVFSAMIANRVLGYVSGDVAGFSGEASYVFFMISWVSI
ncbi:MAG: adenosylcobinamide-GDP ribazoletransferase [Sulfolobales archaeon]